MCCWDLALERDPEEEAALAPEGNAMLQVGQRQQQGLFGALLSEAFFTLSEECLSSRVCLQMLWVYVQLPHDKQASKAGREILLLLFVTSFIAAAFPSRMYVTGGPAQSAAVRPCWSDRHKGATLALTDTRPAGHDSSRRV